MRAVKPLLGANSCITSTRTVAVVTQTPTLVMSYKRSQCQSHRGSSKADRNTELLTLVVGIMLCPALWSNR